MSAARPQRTIAKAAAVRGIGYWQSRDVIVEFRPAPANRGIVFIRRDLPGCPRIPATVSNRAETPLRTTLRCGQASVEMIEHIMAALAGLQIDNCEVYADQSEMPGCDGSSLPFVAALEAAGVVELGAPRSQKFVSAPIRLGDGRSWIEARPCHSATTMLQYELDYGPNHPIGRQKLEMVLSRENFRANLAASRTFLTAEDAAALQAQGLCQRATFRDLLVYGPQGPIDNPLRFSDECVRHKLLDMVGDLALAGCDLIGSFAAYRSGHRLNAEMVRAILSQAEGPRAQKRCA